MPSQNGRMPPCQTAPKIYVREIRKKCIGYDMIMVMAMMRSMMMMMIRDDDDDHDDDDVEEGDDDSDARGDVT